MTVCADCGATIERHPRAGWWVSHLPSGAWSFTCRTNPRTPITGKITSADYHYAEGETQRRFTAPGEPER